jgi:hypothetical protein
VNEKGPVTSAIVLALLYHAAMEVQLHGLFALKLEQNNIICDDNKQQCIYKVYRMLTSP